MMHEGIILMHDGWTVKDFMVEGTTKCLAVVDAAMWWAKDLGKEYFDRALLVLETERIRERKQMAGD